MTGRWVVPNRRATETESGGGGTKRCEGKEKGLARVQTKGDQGINNEVQTLVQKPREMFDREDKV